MAKSCTIVVSLLHITTILCITSCPSEGALSYGFYSGSCPNLERIVFDAVARKFFKFPIATANALRIFNHECFVEVSVVTWALSCGLSPDTFIHSLTRIVGMRCVGADIVQWYVQIGERCGDQPVITTGRFRSLPRG